MNTYEQQAIDFLAATGITFTAAFKNSDVPAWEEKGWMHDCFTIILKNKQHRYRFAFWQSAKQSTGNGDNPPTAYDMLASLTKYNPSTFSDFCGEFGYDEDSRKAYKTYKAVMKEYHNLAKLFTPEQMELLQEIN